MRNSITNCSHSPEMRNRRLTLHLLFIVYLLLGACLCNLLCMIGHIDVMFDSNKVVGVVVEPFGFFGLLVQRIVPSNKMATLSLFTQI